jgi:hypothetical protein
MTIAKVYGLSENPFEPTGAATASKYPFVEPENFGILEQKIKEAGIEKKFYPLLVNSPHGAGKTTTMEFLREKATNGGYLSYRAPVILTKLSNLSIINFVQDILNEISKYDGKAARQLRHMSPNQYKEILVSSLSPIAAKSKLMLWIIDEFDILADRPIQEQRDFLQFLRDVVDSFATRDIPIAFIMSHTKYSSREFERHLSETHDPFRSRIITSIPLAYTYDEVRRIVFQRLKKASLNARQEGDISPFTDESLKALYELMLSARGTDKLDNFRVFERICHFALIEGANREMKQINVRLIQDLFKEYGLKEGASQDVRHLTIRTSQEIASLKSKSLMERNEAIIRGLITGIQKSVLLGQNSELSDIKTFYVGPAGVGNIVVNAVTFSLDYQEKPVNVLWFVASNKSEIVQLNELNDLIAMVTSKIKQVDFYSNIKFLSFVSAVAFAKFPENPFNNIFRLSSGVADDLIGLSLGDEQEKVALSKSFDIEISPLLLQIIERETRDITKELSASCIEIVQTLFLTCSVGQACTKESLRQNNKELFMRGSMIKEEYVKEAIQSGFAQEKTGEIEPTIPRALQYLNELLTSPREEKDLTDRFGISGMAVLSAAESLKIIKKDNGRIFKREIADYLNELQPQITYLQELTKSSNMQKSALGKIISWILKSYEGSLTDQSSFSKNIILSAIERLKPKIEAEISKLAQQPFAGPTGGASSTAITTETAPESPKTETAAAPGQFRGETSKDIDGAILSLISSEGALTIQTIDAKMKQAGFQQDIKRTVLRLVLEGKLLVIAPE